MRLFFLLFLISTNVLATEWSKLVKGNEYSITQAFSLSQLERSGSRLEISRGDKVHLKDVIALSEIKVILYVFDYKNCPGPAMKTEMEIIPVQMTTPVVEIGAKIEENCELHIHIENKDLMSKSLFE